MRDRERGRQQDSEISRSGLTGHAPYARALFFIRMEKDFNVNKNVNVTGSGNVNVTGPGFDMEEAARLLVSLRDPGRTDVQTDIVPGAGLYAAVTCLSEYMRGLRFMVELTGEGCFLTDDGGVRVGPAPLVVIFGKLRACMEAFRREEDIFIKAESASPYRRYFMIPGTGELLTCKEAARRYGGDAPGLLRVRVRACNVWNGAGGFRVCGRYEPVADKRK